MAAFREDPTPMGVTIKEIAAAAGVSWQTVSLVMRDKGRVGEATRRRVRATAERLGYRPNGAARAYRTGRFDCVALVLGAVDERSDLPIGLLRGVQEELGRNDMHLSVARLPDAELARAGFVPRVLRENSADGMLINYTHGIPRRMLELIERSRAPAVWLNTNLPRDCVCPDDEEAACRLTRHLLGLGHRRIAYVKTDASSHYSTAERRRGYEMAMAEAGLAPLAIDRAVRPRESGPLFDALLAAEDRRPTALILRPEDLATAAYCAACRGLRVPRDISLVCIAGAELRLAGADVTAAIVPSRQEGIEAVRMLLARIRTPGASFPARRIPFDFVAGATCAPPASRAGLAIAPHKKTAPRAHYQGRSNSHA
jgi:LacI family transcriptional regulator